MRSQFKKGQGLSIVEETVRFIGVLVLITCLKFSDSRDLWSTSSKYKYVPAAGFGHIMYLNRF